MLQIPITDICLLVYDYDGCGISQLFECFWAEHGRSWARQNACYRRLRQLVRAEYLRATRIPSLSGIGGGPLFLTLGPRGRQLLAEQLHLPIAELRQQRRIETPYTAVHHLAICSYRLALFQACRRTLQVSLESWVSERELRGRPLIRVADPLADAGASRSIPLIWDGEFTLAYPDGTELAVRVEIDLATIPVKRMRARLRGYLAYAKHDERPVLWVVPDARRARAINDWAMQEAAALSADPTLFWMVRQDQVCQESILAPIYQVVAGPQLGLLPDFNS